MDGEVLLDTYYVYDNYGNLRMVLPPAASDLLTSTTTPASWIETAAAIQKYAYIYKYDGRNRCIYKKLPGCDPVYTVYDSADRPIFVQDGMQRSKGEWSFSIPDVFGRIVLTGTCKNTLDYTNDPLKNVVVKATRSSLVSQTNVLKGYDLPSGFALTTPTVLSVNYYDRYSFIGANGIPSGASTAYEKVAGYDKLRTEGVKGLLTGTLTAKISPNGTVSGYLYSVMYYDERGRMIQQRGNNSLAGEDKIFTAYDFPGNPTQVRKVHTVGADTRTEVYVHTYDPAERLLKTTYQLDNAAAVTLVNNTYDEVGRLKSDGRNGNAKLKTEYAYNVRSWTKSITGTLFSQTLNYQEVITGNTPCYNGNISSMLWKAGTETSQRGYRFTYDGLSRLKDALYGEGATLAANTNRFNEQITAYDKMGNILGLKRYGQMAASSYGLIDNLTLTYNGNQLQAIKDVATSSVYGNGTEFKDNSNQTVEYVYDKNGNLTKDLNKNISSIRYNILNLPNQVIFAGGNSVLYEYAADGTKLRTVHKTGATTLTTDYCGNAIYENGVLKMLLNEAGYVSFPDKKNHFYLKDHQGNTRVVADKDGNVEETNAYYPFGGTFTSAFGVQPYKYNGKELDAKNGLNWYDYRARNYDAALGRWHVGDPMTEKNYKVNPYNYCLNNPILFIDPNGKREWPVNNTYKGYGKRHENNFGAARSNNRTHKGVDINHTGGGNSDKGAPIVATHDGTVTRVATIAGGDKDAGGNRVVITSSDGSVSTSYMHLDGINSNIKVGVTIAEGQQLGTMGGSGKGIADEYSAHLHYEINVNGIKVNPTTSTTSLIDPQNLIEPIDGGSLPEVVVNGRKLNPLIPKFLID
ncbi:RHS repeat-associated core domain-containing protein [Bacteroides sp.]|uniref:RHS repeat-associated core domain-containing protein n=1 Tax=Bacteroides sp. TaxID=29523 RepID=UPI002617AA9C|nr:RHS repeat-associated core domain-containing protein [Bacteroides sp.]MDD3037133.1 peptidoglycan DD-metalloendopeptidase family protein [Bacteroides sp.]